jgi:hypothetical protein
MQILASGSPHSTGRPGLVMSDKQTTMSTGPTRNDALEKIMIDCLPVRNSDGLNSRLGVYSESTVVDARHSH